MEVITKIKQDTYYDSVTLMLVSSEIEKMEAVEEAMIGMGTDYNIDSLKRLEMFDDDHEETTPNDLILTVKAADTKAGEEAIETAEKKLKEKSQSSGGVSAYNPPTQEGGADMLPGANMVLISVPGEHAAKEAHEALDNDRHVMLFSDNVSLDEELELKQKAVDKGLLMMGPDCGTSIINGVPLAFANAVREGNIGLVAASGTGLQETTSIIHQLGGGVSQAIGVGGRDLSAEIEGRMTLLAAAALDRDDNTDVITLISKPPDETVLAPLLKELNSLSKPVVIYFIGADPATIEAEGFTAARDLENAAVQSCRLAGIDAADSLINQAEIEEKAAELQLSGPYLRGLYSGGTLCDEAQRILYDQLDEIYSNTPVEGCAELADLYQSEAHTIIDLGEDEFTRGRAHPMIDPTLRKERIIQEMKDPETGIILLDVVLGYGAHPDMAGALADAIEEGKSAADNPPLVAASICGTDQDPQNYEQQQNILEQVGGYVFPSNVSMVKFACHLFETT